jgi:hypothetical protein
VKNRAAGSFLHGFCRFTGTSQVHFVVSEVSKEAPMSIGANFFYIPLHIKLLLTLAARFAAKKQLLLHPRPA